MACIIIETPQGTRYTWPDNTPRRAIPGEQIVGIDWACEPTNTYEDTLADLLQREEIPWGKVVKYAALKLGAKHCSRCSAREVILDEAKTLGWVETMKRLKETL